MGGGYSGFPLLLLPHPLPSIWVPTAHAHIAISSSQFCYGRVAGSWSFRSWGQKAKAKTEFLHTWLVLPRMSLSSGPGLYCVLSSGDCSSQLSPLAPWALPWAEAKTQSSQFLGNQGLCRCPYDRGWGNCWQSIIWHPWATLNSWGLGL